jgi:hypothetical protein
VALVFLGLVLSSPRAATIPLSQIPLGKVVSINGLNFVKIAENKYQAVCGQMACANVEHCAACSLNAGNACYACESGYYVENGSCEEGEPTPSVSATLQDFTSAMCSTASTGVVAAVTNNGRGVYVIIKLADGHCYVNMHAYTQWYGSMSNPTGDCNPADASFAACHICYGIGNNNDWFLPTKTQYDVLVSAAGSDQLYAVLSPSTDEYFWSSSEDTSSYPTAVALYNRGTVYVTSTWKTSYYGVLCRHI